MKDRTIFFLFITCPVWIAYILIGVFTMFMLPEVFWKEIGMPIIYCNSCSFQNEMVIKVGLFYLPIMFLFGLILMKLEKKGINIKIN